MIRWEECEVLLRKSRSDGKPQRKILNKGLWEEVDCEKGGRRQKPNIHSLILRNDSVKQYLLFIVCLSLSHPTYTVCH